MGHVVPRCDSNNRTVVQIKNRWLLAACACCRPSSAAPKRYCKASPFPPLRPHPLLILLLLLLLLLLCRSLWFAWLQVLHPRAKRVPLLLRSLRCIRGPLSFLLCILQLPPELQVHISNDSGSNSPLEAV